MDNNSKENTVISFFGSKRDFNKIEKRLRECTDNFLFKKIIPNNKFGFYIIQKATLDGLLEEIQDQLYETSNYVSVVGAVRYKEESLKKFNKNSVAEYFTELDAAVEDVMAQCVNTSNSEPSSSFEDFSTSQDTSNLSLPSSEKELQRENAPIAEDTGDMEAQERKKEKKIRHQDQSELLRQRSPTRRGRNISSNSADTLDDSSELHHVQFRDFPERSDEWVREPSPIMKTRRGRKLSSSSADSSEARSEVFLQSRHPPETQPLRSDVYIAMLALIGLVFIYLLQKSWYPEPSSPASMERYFQELEKMKSEFPQQERFWRTVNATMRNHIFDEEPRQPAVLMMGSMNGASATREKLARQIAEIYSMKCNGSDFVQIDGSEYSALDHSKAKMKLDSDILKKFEGGSCAVVVSNFEKLPAASTTVFYQFCENDFAPFKKVLVLFTTEISDWDWMTDDRAKLLVGDTPKPRFWSHVVEDFLQKSLQKRDDSGIMTVDMIGGLLARITPLVAWVEK